MLYLALGAAVAILLIWAGRRGRLQRPQLRLAAGVASVVAFAAAGFAATRGQWLGSLVLAGLGAFFAPLARAPQSAAPDAGGSGMTAPEARSILGVAPDATREEIQAAYRRLMRMAHPDQGGTSGLAAKLNAARERLLE